MVHTVGFTMCVDCGCAYLMSYEPLSGHSLTQLQVYELNAIHLEPTLNSPMTVILDSRCLILVFLAMYTCLFGTLNLILAWALCELHGFK